ncbi:MJ0042-type zinc finger domain-containing protein [Tardiphaga sp.]|uniref:MJ0042-type zinc finger domain-containing protein n=1 Tax=Tardiphaga sp. TaxID=1926292 RepID=UPI00262E2BE8|nr:MJ0042-type zinc finger domain-containing protein [Tardiphaga sp.]MDB5619333.1 Thioredoxin [Tardiphaga sp.]
MHIVCPHCTTSFAVNPATFGDAGRMVRCSRCKEVWLAQPEELEIRVPAMADPDPNEDMSAWGITEDEAEETSAAVPMVESPSISMGLPAQATDADWTAMARDETPAAPRFGRRSPLSRLRRLIPNFTIRIPYMPRPSLSAVCAGMAALVVALMVWRVDVVRLMPQTAGFYRLVGLNVNLRGLSFKDVKVAMETVEGKPVLVIEGNIVGESKTMPVAMPRLRFVVRDALGTEIYAWNAVLEQQGLNPGDKAWFRSRLASPPAEGRSLDVRFFNKRDLAS